MIPAKPLFALADTSLTQKLNTWGIDQKTLQKATIINIYIKINDPTHYYFTVDKQVPKKDFFCDFLPIWVCEPLTIADLVYYIKNDVKKAYCQSQLDIQKWFEKWYKLHKKNNDLFYQNKSLLQQVAILTQKLNTIKSIA
jgi:hypothetical protein